MNQYKLIECQGGFVHSSVLLSLNTFLEEEKEAFDLGYYLKIHKKVTIGILLYLSGTLLLYKYISVKSFPPTKSAPLTPSNAEIDSFDY